MHFQQQWLGNWFMSKKAREKEDPWRQHLHHLLQAIPNHESKPFNKASPLLAGMSLQCIISNPAEQSICQSILPACAAGLWSPVLICWIWTTFSCHHPAPPFTQQTHLAVPTGKAASLIINRRGKQNSQLVTHDFPHAALLFANFGNKLTCDPGWEGQLNSYWPEKVHQGVLGEAEQGTGSAPCIGCDFL